MEWFNLFFTICFFDSSIFSHNSLCSSLLLSTAGLWSFWFCSKYSCSSIYIPPLFHSFHFLCSCVSVHPETFCPVKQLFCQKFSSFCINGSSFWTLSKFSLKINNLHCIFFQREFCLRKIKFGERYYLNKKKVAFLKARAWLCCSSFHFHSNLDPTHLWTTGHVYHYTAWPPPAFTLVNSQQTMY